MYNDDRARLVALLGDKLVALLGELAAPTYWSCLQDWWQRQKDHEKWVSDWEDASTRHFEVEQYDAMMECDDRANHKMALARDCRLSALQAKTAFVDAKAMLTVSAPDLLGDFPLDDREFLASKSPETLATQCERIRGLVLARALQGDPGASKQAAPSGKKATVQARMYDTIKLRPESNGWTKRQWSDYLGCSESAVQRTRIWHSMQITKGTAKLEKTAGQGDRRRR